MELRKQVEELAKKWGAKVNESKEVKFSFSELMHPEFLDPLGVFHIKEKKVCHLGASDGKEVRETAEDT